MSDEAIAGFDPRHPHERDGRTEAPVMDADGRCLICSRDYLAEVLEGRRLIQQALEAVAAERDAAGRRINELTAQLRYCIDAFSAMGRYGDLRQWESEATQTFKNADITLTRTLQVTPRTCINGRRIDGR